jgi:RimJ/RimL family protein N-acetyltransferase
VLAGPGAAAADAPALAVQRRRKKILNLYYRFRPEAWGKGSATEMASAVIAWADRTLPQYAVQISVHVDNEPSLAVARRLGFRTHSHTRYEGALTRHSPPNSSRTNG